MRPLIVLFIFVSVSAHAQDRPLREMIDEANRQAGVQDTGFVGACMIGDPIAVPGMVRVMVENRLAGYGLIIEYIRPLYGDTKKRLNRGRIFIVERGFMRRAMVTSRDTGTEKEVSILQPDERCTLWLPPGSWAIVASRVPIVGAGYMMQDCPNGACQWVDTARYGKPSEWSIRSVSDLVEQGSYVRRLSFDRAGGWNTWVLVR